MCFFCCLTLIAWHFSHISAAHFVQNLIILTELFAAFGALRLGQATTRQVLFLLLLLLLLLNDRNYDNST